MIDRMTKGSRLIELLLFPGNPYHVLPLRVLGGEWLNPFWRLKRKLRREAFVFQQRLIESIELGNIQAYLRSSPYPTEDLRFSLREWFSDNPPPLLLDENRRYAVRSSGPEDLPNMPNAGVFVSLLSVAAPDVANAIADVIVSYFDPASYLRITSLFAKGNTLRSGDLFGAGDIPLTEVIVQDMFESEFKGHSPEGTPCLPPDFLRNVCRHVAALALRHGNGIDSEWVVDSDVGPVSLVAFDRDPRSGRQWFSVSAALGFGSVVDAGRAAVSTFVLPPSLAEVAIYSNGVSLTVTPKGEPHLLQVRPLPNVLPVQSINSKQFAGTETKVFALSPIVRVGPVRTGRLLLAPNLQRAVQAMGEVELEPGASVAGLVVLRGTPLEHAAIVASQSGVSAFLGSETAFDELTRLSTVQTKFLVSPGDGSIVHGSSSFIDSLAKQAFHTVIRGGSLIGAAWATGKRTSIRAYEDDIPALIGQLVGWVDISKAIRSLPALASVAETAEALTTQKHHPMIIWLQDVMSMYNLQDLEDAAFWIERIRSEGELPSETALLPFPWISTWVGQSMKNISAAFSDADEPSLLSAGQALRHLSIESWTLAHPLIAEWGSLVLQTRTFEKIDKQLWWELGLSTELLGLASDFGPFCRETADLIVRRNHQELETCSALLALQLPEAILPVALTVIDRIATDAFASGELNTILSLLRRSPVNVKQDAAWLYGLRFIHHYGGSLAIKSVVDHASDVSSFQSSISEEMKTVSILSRELMHDLRINAPISANRVLGALRCIERCARSAHEAWGATNIFSNLMAEFIEIADIFGKNLALALTQHSRSAARDYHDLLSYWHASYYELFRGALDAIDKRNESWIKKQLELLAQSPTWEVSLGYCETWFSRLESPDRRSNLHQIQNNLHQNSLVILNRAAPLTAYGWVAAIHRTSNAFRVRENPIVRLAPYYLELDLGLTVHKTSAVFSSDGWHVIFVEPPASRHTWNGRVARVVALRILVEHVGRRFPDIEISSVLAFQFGDASIEIRARSRSGSAPEKWAERIFLEMLTLFESTYQFSGERVDTTSHLKAALSQESFYRDTVDKLSTYRRDLDFSGYNPRPQDNRFSVCITHMCLHRRLFDALDQERVSDLETLLDFGVRWMTAHKLGPRHNESTMLCFLAALHFPESLFELLIDRRKDTRLTRATLVRHLLARDHWAQCWYNNWRRRPTVWQWRELWTANPWWPTRKCSDLLVLNAEMARYGTHGLPPNAEECFVGYYLPSLLDASRESNMILKRLDKLLTRLTTNKGFIRTTEHNVRELRDTLRWKKCQSLHKAWSNLEYLDVRFCERHIIDRNAG